MILMSLSPMLAIHIAPPFAALVDKVEEPPVRPTPHAGQLGRPGGYANWIPSQPMSGDRFMKDSVQMMQYMHVLKKSSDAC